MNVALQDRLRRIEGRHNPLLKAVRRAFAKSELTTSGGCAVEGLRVVEEAIRSGLKLEAVLFSESASTVANRLLPQIGKHTDALLLPDKLFRSVVPSESPQGVAAVVQLRDFALEKVVKAAGTGVLLVIVGVQDPGNVGTMLRSAEAFGAGGVILAENTVSMFNPKVVRGSAGSIFRVPITRTPIADVLPLLRTEGVTLRATSSHKGAMPWDLDWKKPVAVFIGTEGAGLPRDLLAKMDDVLAIPHSSKVESLNAAVAASIVLYEAAKQKALTTEAQ
ncbi:MAG TPA: RNA methyltransferase [Terriglobales bacterium]|nr:RNA methyltransferase [Terriglobales bacterium]